MCQSGKYGGSVFYIAILENGHVIGFSVMEIEIVVYSFLRDVARSINASYAQSLNCRMAQWPTRATEERNVAGSTPYVGTDFCIPP
jgi:hypothetical protein